MATDEFIYDRFITEFGKFSNVEIYFGGFEALADVEKVDCLVSPANSFGLMDGGMDQAITDYFGEQLQKRVQQHITENYASEQPVGTSFIIETHNEKIPYLAHTPTMRVPAIVKDTDNAYLAMRATMIEAEKHENINTVAVPAFCYGVGQMHGSDVAYQMAKAYLQIIAQPQKIDWNYAMSVNYAIDKYK